MPTVGAVSVHLKGSTRRFTHTLVCYNGMLLRATQSSQKSAVVVRFQKTKSNYIYRALSREKAYVYQGCQVCSSNTQRSEKIDV